MSTDKLSQALGSVDWKKNVDTFLKDSEAAKEIAAANMRIAVWSRQFENADQGNAALCFAREMQIAGQQVAVLTALSLYKSAAASMRTMFETSLYYSYFRTHPSELETLVRKSDFYLEKKELLEYHKLHSARFNELQHKLGVIQRTDAWYREMSAIVHGQIPGIWTVHKSVAEISPSKETQDLVIAKFKEGVEIINRFFLCTVAQQLWDNFSPASKKHLLAGLPGDMKIALSLDAA